MPKHRLESFSDGVFAVVITLLILNVHLDRDQELTWLTLASLGPDVLAFALTFVIVGVYWVSHHSMIHMIKAVARAVVAQPPAAARRGIHTVSRIPAWPTSVESPR